VRDLQLQCPLEQDHHRGVELAAGEELEARAEGAVVDEDADELLHHRFGVFHEFGEPAADLLQGRQREFCPYPFPYLSADRLAVQCHRGLAGVADVFQEPPGGERVPAQREGPQRGVRPEADLDPPVFDAHQVAAADRRRAPGFPPGVPGEPVHRIGRDGPDPALVPDGQGSAGRGEPDVHGDVQGCFIRCCCHGLRVLPGSCSSFLRGG
jgi:hypothetical protein